MRVSTTQPPVVAVGEVEDSPQTHTRQRHRYRVGPYRLVQSRKQHACERCEKPVKKGLSCYTRRTARDGRFVRLWVHVSCVQPLQTPPVDRNPSALQRLRKALTAGKGVSYRLQLPKCCALCPGEILRGMVAIRWRTARYVNGERKSLDYYVHTTCRDRLTAGPDSG